MSFVTQSYGQIVRLCMRFFRPYPIRVSVLFYLNRLGCLCQTCSFLFSFTCLGLSFYNDCTRSYVAFPHTGFCIKINNTYWILPLAAGFLYHLPSTSRNPNPGCVWGLVQDLGFSRYLAAMEVEKMAVDSEILLSPFWKTNFQLFWDYYINTRC